MSLEVADGDRFRISCVVNPVIALWRLRIARQFGGAWCRAGDRFRRRRTAAAHHPERLPLGSSVREWFALGQVVVGPLKGVAGESEVAEGGRLGRVQQLGAGRVVGFEQALGDGSKACSNATRMAAWPFRRTGPSGAKGISNCTSPAILLARPRVALWCWRVPSGGA
jgi:hypothetical protein